MKAELKKAAAPARTQQGGPQSGKKTQKTDDWLLVAAFSWQPKPVIV